MKWLPIFMLVIQSATAAPAPAEVYGPPEPLVPIPGVEHDSLIETVSALQKDASLLRARIVELQRELQTADSAN